MASGGDYRKLDRLIADLERLASGRPVQELVHRLGQDALELVDEGFARGHDPGGKPWPLPKRRRGGKPMILSGRLRASYVVRYGPKRFEISTPKAYAFMLQAGFKKVEPRATLPGRGRDIPARWDRIFRARAATWMHSVIR